MSPRTFALLAPLCLVLSTALQAERVGFAPDSSSDTTAVLSAPAVSNTLTVQSAPSAETSSAIATTAVSVQDLPIAAAIAAPAGLQRQQQLTHDFNPIPSSAGNNGPNVAMMIVGGAAIVVGAVVGGTPGTLFMVGGGVVGLYGLWKYLQ